MDSDVMARILAQVTIGIPKAEAKGFKMDDEASAAWDRIEAEVAEAKAKGQIIDVPNEWPAPNDSLAAPPAAEAPPAPDTPAAPAAPTAAQPPAAAPAPAQ